MRRVLWAAHARDVNILIWTPRKSVGHETNDRVMVHGDGTRADGRRSKQFAKMNKIVGSGDGRAALVISGQVIKCSTQSAGWMAHLVTEAPETQIYFINHRSGANSVPRVRAPSIPENGQVGRL